MYSPSISPLRRNKKTTTTKTSQQPNIRPHRKGDFQFLTREVDEQRSATRNSRSALASALDQLGEHHVRNKEYDDAMNAFTEALHEKRSVFAQLLPDFCDIEGSRCGLGSEDAHSSLDPDMRDVHDETVDAIVNTLRHMGNVHSLRGEHDEAMRYYSEVTNLRASKQKGYQKDSSMSVSSFSKSSGPGSSMWDEDNSTLMSEINEDVKALDDLFRSISFRNNEGKTTQENIKPQHRQQVINPSQNQDSSREKTKKRRRGDGLRENGSSENEPFKRTSSVTSRTNNELGEALEAYRRVISNGCSNHEQHQEQLNSFTLRSELLEDSKKEIEDSTSFPLKAPEGRAARFDELHLALEVYREVLMAQQQEYQQHPTADTEQPHQASANIASTLIRMGSLCYKLNNVEEELELYRRAKTVYCEAFGDNHEYVAGTRKNIGMVLAERGEYEGSIQEFEKARRIYLVVNNHDETSRDIASAISCMGNVKNRMGELDEALEHYVHALKIYQKVRQRESNEESIRDVTATMKIIGMVFAKKGELDTAMGYFKQAISLLHSSGITKAKTGKETLASVSSRIAGIHFKKGEYELAMKFYREAHEVTVETKGVNHPEVASILHYIGGIHHKHKDYEEAMTCYQEAVRIYHSTLGPGNPAVAATLVCIGSIHYKRRNLDSAVMFYREALRLNRDAYGLHHPDVAPTLKSIGTILTKKGEYDEAYDVFRDVLSIKCTVHGTGHPEVANAYKSLGNIHYKRGELADAERQYRHALNIFRRTKGEEHADTIGAKTSIEHIRYWMKERGHQQQQQQRHDGRTSSSQRRISSDERSC